jgi:hypothetical protein
MIESDTPEMVPADSDGGALNVEKPGAPEGTPDSQQQGPERQAPVSPHGSDPLGLSLGIQIGVLVGLTLFAGMYSLCANELRIAGTIFLAGVTLALAGGAVVGLTCDAYHLQRAGAVPGSGSRFWESMWEGVAVGLGILLGALPISLVCSLFCQTPLFPQIIYYTGAILLVIVGIARARSFRAVPASIAYALLPALGSILVAHAIGDLLYERMQTF